MKKIIRLDESDLVNIVKNTLKEMKMKLNEYASALLYRFVTIDDFFGLVNYDRFKMNEDEPKFNNGKNSLSFTRVKSFREGYPTTMRFDWCAIRLTVDGDLINRKPNFKENGKQMNMKVKPFDYWYKDLGGVQNGKQLSMVKNKNDMEHYTTLPIGRLKDDGNFNVTRLQSHSYNETEDRLYSDSKTIPNAHKYILRVDILLMPYKFNQNNYYGRYELYNLITDKKYRDKIHLYKSIEDLEYDELSRHITKECDKDILLIKDNDNLSEPYKKTNKNYDSMHYFTE